MNDHSNPSATERQHEVTNVATVRHLSPFRFPGGKTWLVPRIRQWLVGLRFFPKKFIEPFAGGAIVGLTIAYEKLAELDDAIASVWQVIINAEDDALSLATRIQHFQMSMEAVDAVLKMDVNSLCDLAFHTILRNRVNHGGILAPGAGRLKKGENERGLMSRWYPETLRNRILKILAFRENISFIHGDGLSVIENNKEYADTVFFIDPPYTAGNTKAGARLYTHFSLAHEELFELAKQIKGDFVMTYDNDPTVLDLAKKHGFDFQEIVMKNTHHTKMTELIIGNDLTWLRTDSSFGK